jgi:hypothetical protein
LICHEIYLFYRFLNKKTIVWRKKKKVSTKKNVVCIGYHIYLGLETNKQKQIVYIQGDRSHKLFFCCVTYRRIFIQQIFYHETIMYGCCSSSWWVYSFKEEYETQFSSSVMFAVCSGQAFNCYVCDTITSSNCGDPFSAANYGNGTTAAADPTTQRCGVCIYI